MPSTTGGTTKNGKLKLLRPRISAEDAAFATVLVGPEHTRFVIHENLLVHYSKFFRAALTGNFREAKDKTVKLEEDDPDVFEFFVHWLYYQQLPSADGEDDPKLLARWEEHDIDHRLVQMYIFADKNCIDTLQRQVLDEFFDYIGKMDMLPGAYTTNLAFTNLSPEAAICRLIVSYTCYYEKDTMEPDEFQQDWNTTFVFCMWKRYREVVNNEDVPRTRRLTYKLWLCDYHDHTTEEEKMACKKRKVNHNRFK